MLKALDTRIHSIKDQSRISFAMFVVAFCLAWEIGNKIVASEFRVLEFGFLIAAACAVALTILKNWRLGFYMFFVWVLFEDLVRKYMGNGTLLFFGKDVLLALIYISFLAAVRKGREKTFRPPFLLFLSLFFWLCVLQMFNENSPSIWYGLLGIKMYLYYAPLLFVGYALVRTDKDLSTFLNVNMLLAIAVSVVGIMQSVLGNSFLNPSNLPPALEELGNLEKTTTSGQVFNLPDSVFVSSGRYSQYLSIAFIISMAAVAYFLLCNKRHRVLGFVALSLVVVATLLSGNRGSFVSMLMSAVLLSVGFLWGAPWRWRQAHRIVKAIRRSLLVTAAGLAILFAAFPREAGSRLAFYTETLLPSSESYQLGQRVWDYPVQNFEAVFSQPNWVLGNGIGTASLGVQYVARLTHRTAPGLGVEEGFGTLIVEMGLIAPCLWILWTAALLYYSWGIIRRLRETHLFPVGLAIGWYAFVLLYLWTYASFVGYEDYTCNVFCWLLAGILFRMPDLMANAPNPAVVFSDRDRTRRGFRF